MKTNPYAIVFIGVKMFSPILMTAAILDMATATQKHATIISQLGGGDYGRVEKEGFGDY